MRDFLYETLIEPIKEGDLFLAILSWIIFLFFFGLISGLIIIGIDSINMPIKEKQGVIVSKNYEAHYTYTTYISSGEVTIPQFHYVPESFNLTIEVEELQDNVKVYESYYERLKIGQKVDVEYTKGRLFKTIYIKNFKEIN